MDRKIAELNDRYQQGRPSSDLRQAGVLVHTWDERDDFDAPWTVLHGSRFDANSHKISASVVWAAFAGQLRKHIFFRRGPKLQGGFVLSPFHNQFNCAYAGDANTNNNICFGKPGCVSGCGAPPHWCDYSTPGWKGHCSTHPNDLDHILKDMEPNDRAGCNELIFEQVVFERNLPHSVEAIWYDPKQSPSHGAAEREVHRKFCERFGLKLDQLPFVRLGEGGHEPLFLS